VSSDEQDRLSHPRSRAEPTECKSWQRAATQDRFKIEGFKSKDYKETGIGQETTKPNVTNEAKRLLKTKENLFSMGLKAKGYLKTKQLLCKANRLLMQRRLDSSLKGEVAQWYTKAQAWRRWPPTGPFTQTGVSGLGR
jgi:hypothetical protein